MESRLGARPREDTWTQTFERFSYGTVSELAREIEDHFQMLDVKLHPQSSLGRAIAAVRELAELQQKNEPIGKIDEGALSKLDGLRIAERIGRGLRLFADSAILQEKLRSLTNDHLEPHIGQRSRSRNVAFELHTAVRIAMSPWKVELGEPNLIGRLDATIMTFTGDGGQAIPVSVSQMAVTPLAKEGYPYYRVCQSLVPIRKNLGT